ALRPVAATHRPQDPDPPRARGRASGAAGLRPARIPGRGLAQPRTKRTPRGAGTAGWRDRRASPAPVAPAERRELASAGRAARSLPRPRRGRDDAQAPGLALRRGTYPRPGPVVEVEDR